jgi:hypothetical protein
VPLAGTIDALLCCKQGTENVMRMLLETYRCEQQAAASATAAAATTAAYCTPQLAWVRQYTGKRSGTSSNSSCCSATRSKLQQPLQE